MLGYIESLFCIDHWQLLIIDVERFAGLNVHGFNLIEIFTEILLCCLDQKCLLFSIIKEKCLYSQKNFCGSPENHKYHETLAK